MTTSNEVSQIGKFISDSKAARFYERGILDYTRKSVQLDMELLEDICEEVCRGMDAFDTVMDLDAPSNTQRITALAIFLLQLMERMAMKLEVFYSKLAENSVYHPELEQNPARTLWNVLRRRVRDVSFFVLAQDLTIGANISHVPHRGNDGVEFDQVISQIQKNITSAPT
jgi:hypothetical protein